MTEAERDHLGEEVTSYLRSAIEAADAITEYIADKETSKVLSILIVRMRAIVVELEKL